MNQSQFHLARNAFLKPFPSFENCKIHMDFADRYGLPAIDDTFGVRLVLPHCRVYFASGESAAFNFTIAKSLVPSLNPYGNNICFALCEFRLDHQQNDCLLTNFETAQALETMGVTPFDDWLVDNQLQLSRAIEARLHSPSKRLYAYFDRLLSHGATSVEIGDVISVEYRK